MGFQGTPAFTDLSPYEFIAVRREGRAQLDALLPETWNRRKFQLVLTQKQWSLSYYVPADFRNVVKRRTEAQLLPPLPKKERLWLTRYQRGPKGRCCYDCPSQMWIFAWSFSWHWEANHRPNGRASHPLLRESCVVLAWLKAILGNYYCQIWSDSGFQRKPNHCQVIWKRDESHGWDPARTWGSPLFLPSALPEGQGEQGRREEEAPHPPHGPLLGGPGLRLLACGHGCQLRWRFKGRCFKSVGTNALARPVQSFSISRQALVERGASELLCPAPSYQQEQLWRLLASTHKPPWIPNMQLLPNISLWSSSMFPICLHTGALGVINQDGHSWLQGFTDTKNSDLQYLNHVIDS